MILIANSVQAGQPEPTRLLLPGAATGFAAVVFPVRDCSGILRSRYSGKPGALKAGNGPGNKIGTLCIFHDQ